MLHICCCTFLQEILHSRKMDYSEMQKPIFQRQIHMVTNLRGGHVMKGYSSFFSIVFHSWAP
jgi:hypothetical protein